MSLNIEFIQHLEGIADQSHYGFSSVGLARLTTVNHPLDLVAKYTVNNIFGSYHTKRELMLQQILEGKIVAGFWNETLFPGIKDIIRYGADWLSEGDRASDVVQAGVDAAAATLSTIFP